MPTEFISGPDWQCSSGPHQPEAYDASADLWPHGAASEIGGGSKDVLADGLHPVLAVGPKAQRPKNLTGVVVTYNATLDRAIMNMAEKVCVKQYVANVLTYTTEDAGAPATYDTSMAIGEPVYVDDSDALGAGVTLSRSPLNSAGSANPLAGYLFYCQTEYDDSGIGGAEASASWPKTVAESLVEAEYCVLLTNDYGTTDLDAYLAAL
jgi:hypothetical protein